MDMIWRILAALVLVFVFGSMGYKIYEDVANPIGRTIGVFLFVFLGCAGAYGALTDSLRQHPADIRNCVRDCDTDRADQVSRCYHSYDSDDYDSRADCIEKAGSDYRSCVEQDCEHE